MGSLRASPHTTGVAVVGSEVAQVVVTRQGTGLVVRWDMTFLPEFLSQCTMV